MSNKEKYDSIKDESVRQLPREIDQREREINKFLGKLKSKKPMEDKPFLTEEDAKKQADDEFPVHAANEMHSGTREYLDYASLTVRKQRIYLKGFNAAVEKANAEVSRLRSEVERLEKERDKEIYSFLIRVIMKHILTIFFEKVFGFLVEWKEEKSNPPCAVDCPKGGICPRKICSNFSGVIWVENHFDCLKVKDQVIRLKKIFDENKANKSKGIPR